MFKRAALPLILLLLLAVGQIHAAPIDATDANLKGAEQSEGAEPSVPASNPWGMMLMVMLVLTATSMALFRGGMNQGGVQESMASARRSGIEFEPAQPVEPTKSVPAKAVRRSKLRKPKLDPEQRQFGRRGWHISRQQNNHDRPGGRRSGPGCRGIR